MDDAPPPPARRAERRALTRGCGPAVIPANAAGALARRSEMRYVRQMDASFIRSPLGGLTAGAPDRLIGLGLLLLRLART